MDSFFKTTYGSLMYLSSCIKMTVIHNNRVGTFTEMHKEIVGDIECDVPMILQVLPYFYPRTASLNLLPSPSGFE